MGCQYNATSPVCDNNGVCSSGQCNCDTDYFGQYCETSIYNSAISTPVKIYTSFFIVIYSLMLAATVWRVAVVLRWKMHLVTHERSLLHSFSRPSDSFFSRFRYAFRHGASQFVALLLVIGSSIFHLLSVVFDPITNVANFPNLFYHDMAILLIPMAAYVVTRFFASVQAKFDSMTRKTIRVFDAVNWLLFFVWNLFIALYPIISQNVVNVVLDLVGVVWCVIDVVGIYAYGLKVLRPAEQMQTRENTQNKQGPARAQTTATQEAAAARKQLSLVLRVSQVIATILLILALLNAFTQTNTITVYLLESALFDFTLWISLVLVIAIMGHTRERTNANVNRVHPQNESDNGDGSERAVDVGFITSARQQKQKPQKTTFNQQASSNPLPLNATGTPPAHSRAAITQTTTNIKVNEAADGILVVQLADLDRSQ